VEDVPADVAKPQRMETKTAVAAIVRLVKNVIMNKIQNKFLKRHDKIMSFFLCIIHQFFHIITMLNEK